MARRGLGKAWSNTTEKGGHRLDVAAKQRKIAEEAKAGGQVVGQRETFLPFQIVAMVTICLSSIVNVGPECTERRPLARGGF
jgi:hypothetical protein